MRYISEKELTLTIPQSSFSLTYKAAIVVKVESIKLRWAVSLSFPGLSGGRRGWWIMEKDEGCDID
jgi:hypothetical protein